MTVRHFNTSLLSCHACSHVTWYQWDKRVICLEYKIGYCLIFIIVCDCPSVHTGEKLTKVALASSSWRRLRDESLPWWHFLFLAGEVERLLVTYDSDFACSAYSEFSADEQQAILVRSGGGGVGVTKEYLCLQCIRQSSIYFLLTLIWIHAYSRLDPGNFFRGRGEQCSTCLNTDYAIESPVGCWLYIETKFYPVSVIFLKHTPTLFKEIEIIF